MMIKPLIRAPCDKFRKILLAIQTNKKYKFRYLSIHLFSIKNAKDGDYFKR